VSIQFTGQTGVDTLLGKWLLRDNQTYWQDGLFTMACRHGFWIVLDEINMALPEVTAALHSALDDRRVLILDEKDGEVINIHPNTRIFAAINPSEDYVGTKEMNAALVDRFGMKLFTNYPDPRKEVEIIKVNKSVHIDDKPQARTKEGFITRIVKVANQIRNSDDKSMLGRASISSRELINWASLCSIYTAQEAFELAVANKTEWSDRKVREFLKKIASAEFNPTDKWSASSSAQATVSEAESDSVVHL
jgi:cobaltochelatase CobS